MAVEDERLRFFLEHQDLIREWAALATEVQDMAEGMLRDLRVDLANHPDVIREGILVGQSVNGETPTGPVLYRMEWCRTSPALPDVAVALGWDGRIDPSGLWPKTALPYVGVLCARRTGFGQALEPRLREMSLQNLSGEPAFRKGSYWVAYRSVPADRDWWHDVPKWRTRLVGELLGAWGRWAGLIGEAIGEPLQRSDV